MAVNLKERVSNLCLAVLADTWADLTGIVAEIRAESESEPGRDRPAPMVRKFVGHGPSRRTRNREDARTRTRLT
jgi:hypothetical protein